MSIYEQLCRDRKWINHRRPLMLGEIMPPPRKEE